jgi:transcriptional repressor NrdR
MHSYKKEILMQVRKKDDTTEAFMPEKVVVSVLKSGAPYKDARSIADSLSKRSSTTINSSEIRDHVHSQLKSMGHNSSVKSWIRYETEMKNESSKPRTGRAQSAMSTHKTAA